MDALLALLGAEAALAVAYWLARQRGRQRLAHECFVAGMALATTLAVALLLAMLAGDRWSLAPTWRWLTASGTIIMPGVLLGRLVAAWLRPHRRSAPRDEAWERRRDASNKR